MPSSTPAPAPPPVPPSAAAPGPPSPPAPAPSASNEYAPPPEAPVGAAAPPPQEQNNFMAAAGGGANRPPTGGPAAARPGGRLDPKQIKDFQPVTPPRANTKPIYGAEIKPIDEPKHRFDNFQYPPITDDGWGITALDGHLISTATISAIAGQSIVGCEMQLTKTREEWKNFRGYEVMGFTRNDRYYLSQWAPARNSVPFW